jgi:menaquinone-specific isochorismate synthase
MRSDALRGISADIRVTLERAVNSAVDRLASKAVGQLAIVSVTLPFVLDAPLARGAEMCWLSRSQDVAMYGSGVAVRFDDDAGRRFRAETAAWQSLDAETIPPVAWFSVPSATAYPSPSIWIPRVLIRVHCDRTIVTLCAVKEGAAPPTEVGRSWLEALRRLLDPPPDEQHAPSTIVSKASMPDARTWRARVCAAVDAIDNGELVKIVLARRLSIQMKVPVVPGALAERLARDHPECYVLAFPFERGWVVAASPELLASKRDRRLICHALAGTAKRHADLASDVNAASALLASAKERQEHAVVVDAIAAGMADLCENVEHPGAPMVLPLRFLQHLWTPLSGRLRSGVSLLDAVMHLHPTPAILGSPVDAARRWLAKIGESRDGLYSGVVGWIDSKGDGDAVVVLRSAYIEGRTVVLWAGAGIVADSDPDAELTETELKLATMLEALQSA